MTDPSFEQRRPSTPSDSVDASAHGDDATNPIWIAVAIVVAGFCSALSIAYFEPVGCGPLCDLPTDPP